MLSTIFQLSLLFFMLFDALGSFPIFITLLKNFSEEKRQRLILRECLFALATLFVFITFGQGVFHVLGVAFYSFQFAGGVMLFIVGLKMAFGPYISDVSSNKVDLHEPIFFPLAFPVLTGPAVITATLSFMAEKEFSNGIVILSVCLAWVASTFVLLYSTMLNKIMGTFGLVALEKLFSIVLLLMSGSLILKGLGIAFNIGFYATLAR